MTAEFPLAVHALVYLLHKQQTVSSTELAENICTNPARVRKVLSKLCRSGLAVAHHGQGSGYSPAPAGAEVSLGAVLAALEETPVSMNWRSGDIDRDCLVSSGMGAVMDGIYENLNAQCAGYLAQVTIGSICTQIFGK